jgi:hypothetical protein
MQSWAHPFSTQIPWAFKVCVRTKRNRNSPPKQLPTQKALYQGTTLVVPKTSPNDGLYMPRKNALYEGHGFSRAVIGCALDGFSR